MRCIVLWILDQVQYDGEGCGNDVARGVSGRCSAWRAQTPLWILDQVQYDGEGCWNDMTRGGARPVDSRVGGNDGRLSPLSLWIADQDELLLCVA